MSDSDSFESVLDRPAEEFKEPELYPVGTWLLRGVSAKFDRKEITKGDNAGKTADIVNLSFVATEPGEDVDPDDLKDSERYQGRRIYRQFWVVNQNDAYSLRKVVEGAFGIDLSGGRSLKSALSDDFKGTSVWAVLGIRTYTDKNGALAKDNEIKSFAAVE